jgi:glutamate-5-semialdehyde dehydrogenase
MSTLENILKRSKITSIFLANAGTEVKNKILEKISENLQKKSGEIFIQNVTDMKKAEEENLQTPLLKRLKFDQSKLNDVVEGIKGLIKLKDPANRVLEKTMLDDGLILTKISVPIGVIGVIFESRPDALVQIATLCLKSGNCALLKGGSEALNTNRILAKIIVDSINEIEPAFAESIHLLETREDVKNILQYNKYIDLVIPRGSNQFVQYIQKNTLIPVLGHADGICHLYVDKNADIGKAVNVTVDSKTQYVAVCNALETLLVHKDIAGRFLPELKVAMDEKKVILKGDERTRKILSDIEPAVEEDWKTEYLDYILSIKIVDSIEEAIDHINTYGSKHTDSIVTSDTESASRFKSLVDSSSVMVNASTRFSDGFKYGMGAEVGISTNKIHARGPVGLEGLVIYKFILEGNGQTVRDYAEGKKKFKHIPLNGRT